MEGELFSENGTLVSEQVWQERIANIRSLVKEELSDKTQAKKVLAESILQAVLSRVPEKEKFGVMFSGGVDSSLIAFLAKRTKKKFYCYTVGFKDEDTKQPEDVDAAVEAAKLIGVELKTRIYTTQEAEELIHKTVKILGPELAGVVNVGVGSVVVGCIELAKKDKVKYLFSGLGSEEIFAGYERHKKAEDRQAECWQGLFNMYERDLLRDSAIANATHTSFLTPFLDAELIRTSMMVPAKYKMDSEQGKIILREVAEEEGLPKEIAWRKKRAAQYGSRLDRAIDKLARKNGFEFKKDYLASLI